MKLCDTLMSTTESALLSTGESGGPNINVPLRPIFICFLYV